jgi:AcrR family transcriptional regulator
METGLRERKKQRTRETIVRVAHELFAERGYAATSVTDIAEAAEISKGTLFAYFPSKEEILFSGADLRRTLTDALAARPAGVSALDALRGFLVDNLSALDERARRRRELIDGDPQLSARYRARMVDTAGVIAAAVGDDLGEPADALRPRMVAAAAYGALSATEQHRYAGIPEAEAVALIDEAIAFLRGGLDAIAPRTDNR